MNISLRHHCVARYYPTIIKIFLKPGLSGFQIFAGQNRSQEINNCGCVTLTSWTCASCDLQIMTPLSLSSLSAVEADRRHDRGEMSPAGGLLCSGRSRPCGALEAPGRGWKDLHQLLFDTLLLLFIVFVGPSGGVGDGPGGDRPGARGGGAGGLHLHREDAGRTLGRAERRPHQQPAPVPVLPPRTRQTAHPGPRVRSVNTSD